MSRLSMTLVALLILGAVAPPLTYRLLIGGAPEVDARTAQAEIQAGRAVLVDVTGSGTEGRSWPLAEVLAIRTPSEVPPDLAGRPLILRCRIGVSSAWAVSHLRRTGLADCRSLAGGHASWNRALAQNGQTAPVALPLWQQWTLCVTGFGIKPFYMGLSLLLTAWLWRRRDPDLTALRRGLLAFLLGEAACAANYLLWNDDSLLAEYLHGYGMMAAFGFLAWAAMLGLDRCLHLLDADRPCAALPLCQTCAKRQEGPCAAVLLLHAAIPGTILNALMLFFVPLRLADQATTVVGTPYVMSHHLVHQLVEGRLCPTVAIVLLLASWAILTVRGRAGLHLVKALMATALGPLVFGFLRLVLLSCYQDRLFHFLTWEEIGELMAMVGVAWVLWVFRRGLAVPAGEAILASRG